MSLIANDNDRFGSDVTDFRKLVNTLSNDCQTLKSDMDGLQKMWTGEAHKALQSRFDGDYQELSELVKHLEALAGSLEFAESAYVSCENKVGNLIANLRV